MRPDTITLAIEEKYSAEEKADIAERLAIAVAELEVITGEKKVSDAAFNERIKRCDQQITELAKRYNKGTETAQIGCDIKYNHPLVDSKPSEDTPGRPDDLEKAMNLSEEVTRLCDFPHCILFADHDGDHEIMRITEVPPPPHGEQPPDLDALR